MMNMVGMVVVGFLTLMMCWMALIMFKAQKLKGQLLPKTLPKIDELVNNNKRALLYFYSPNCGQCETITPVIDSMKKKSLAVEKIDIATHINVAKMLNVRATPTILVIVNKQIEEIILGAKSPSFIEGLLK